MNADTTRGQQSPDPRAARLFRFGSRRYDAVAGEVSLSYCLDQGPELVEKLVFPHAPWPSETGRQAAFGQALQLLHLIAGVSYYKVAVPREVVFEGAAPDPLLADFLTRLYINGLAEFSYLNHVDVAARLRLVPGKQAPSAPPELLLPERALVAIGGGKDSLVGLDLMRRTGMQLMPVCIGDSKLIGDTVAATGLPLLRIRRALAPELEALNAAGAWNGHVPVTAINSAILVCAAILYGYRYVVFSNERSADEATLITPDGTVVNHQYSKTSAFEESFRTVLRAYVSRDIEYFSILRPFSELDVVRRFSAMRGLHRVYSSCNRNFHLGGSRIASRWCGNCPKCRFAALSLAVFLDPAEVRGIQGADLLSDLEQLEGFRAICGLGQDKPFECVGETGESRVALDALGKSRQWRDHAVVKALLPELGAVEIPAMEVLLRPSTRHFIPQAICRALPGELG